MRVTFSGSVPLRVEVLEGRVAYFSDEQYSLVRVAPWTKRPIGAAKAHYVSKPYRRSVS